MRKWTSRVAASVLGLSVVVTGCSSSVGTKTENTQPIKIGFFSDQTGGGSSLGVAEANTAKLVEALINAKGGIKGRKVAITIIDTKSQDSDAVLAIKQLIDDGATAVVGGTTTSESLAALPTAEKEQVPFIALAAGAGIIKPTKSWVFKTPPTDDLALKAILPYLKAKKITKVAWISSNNAFGDGGKVEFDKLVPGAGLTVTTSERFNLDDKDMTAQLTKIKATTPQAIINWSIPPTASIVTKNFAQLSFQNTMLIQNHGVANAGYLEQSGDAANGVILPAGAITGIDTMPDTNARKKLIVDYMDAYQKKFGQPANGFGGYAYDALMLVAKAIETAGDDRAKVRDALESIKKHAGISGTYSFSKDDHMGLIHDDAFVLIEVKGGKFQSWKQ